MADIPDSPDSREETYLAGIAGQDVELPACPYSRKEAYLAQIGDRLDDVDTKIAALATDFSYKGSVENYAALPASPAVGDVYTTSDDGKMYVWDGNAWQVLNMAGVELLQTTGTATDKAMSQNAVASMAFADPATNVKVQLGRHALASGVDAHAIGGGSNSAWAATAASQGALALGTAAKAIGRNSIAFPYSRASVKGEVSFSVSDSDPGNGYNNSSYRLLSGLYDGQSAHDAATVGQAKGTTFNMAIETSSWTALSGSDPYTYEAVISIPNTTTVDTNSIVELINDQAVLFATYGFAITDVTGQAVTIASIGQPAAEVTLKINVRS